MMPHTENAILITKPACVLAREAEPDEMNRKRLQAWKDRKGQKFKSPYNWYDKARNKIILNDKFLEAREFMAENNIKVRSLK